MDFGDVRVRIALILGMVGLCVYLMWPIGSRISLGLDLKGGIHLVMRVRTDDAVKAEIDLVRERMRSSLAEKGLAPAQIDNDGLDALVFSGIDPARVSDARALLRDQFAQYNVDSPGSGRLRIALRPAEESALRDSAVRQALETIRTRIDKFGVAEPLIQRKGVGPQADQIVVELPGVEDLQRVTDLIGSQAFLEWKLVKVPPGVTSDQYRGADSEQAVTQSFGGTLPADVEILPEDMRTDDGRHVTIFWPVTRSSPITGNDLKNARRDQGRFGDAVVSFLLSADAGRRFEDLTRANQGQKLAIDLDRHIISAPRINAVIAERGIIEGNFTVESAEDLALKLRSGALPAGMDILDERTVGASLGIESIHHGIVASIIGSIVIVLFMLIYYRGAGVNSTLALVVNLLILLAAMASVRSTLTLPGIAGIALTVGMAVDANVLVFERIREELTLGRTVNTAIHAGFDKAFGTIIDSHFTTFTAGMALLLFGTGPVKGFAITLTVGIVANLITALFMSRALFDSLLTLNPRLERLSI